MAQLIFNEDDQALIEGTVREFDPETHESFQSFPDLMPADDWNFVVGYIRDEVSRKAEMCLVASAYAQALIARGLVSLTCIGKLFQHGEETQPNLGYVPEGTEDSLARFYRFYRIAEALPKAAEDDGHSILSEAEFRTMDEIDRRILGPLSPLATV